MRGVVKQAREALLVRAAFANKRAEMAIETRRAARAYVEVARKRPSAAGMARRRNRKCSQLLVRGGAAAGS